MQPEDALNQFLDELIIKNDDSYNRGLELYTFIHRHTFKVYKNNNDTIFINPLEGNTHFPQPKQRILDVLSDESIISNRDLQYVKPIVEYIKEHYLMV